MCRSTFFVYMWFKAFIFLFSGHKIRFTTHPALLERTKNDNTEDQNVDTKITPNDNSEVTGNDIIKTGSDVTNDVQSCDLKNDSNRYVGTEETTTWP